MGVSGEQTAFVARAVYQKTNHTEHLTRNLCVRHPAKSLMRLIIPPVVKTHDTRQTASGSEDYILEQTREKKISKRHHFKDFLKRARVKVFVNVHYYSVQNESFFLQFHFRHLFNFV